MTKKELAAAAALTIAAGFAGAKLGAPKGASPVQQAEAASQPAALSQSPAVKAYFERKAKRRSDCLACEPKSSNTCAALCD